MKNIRGKINNKYLFYYNIILFEFLMITFDQILKKIMCSAVTGKVIESMKLKPKNS